ncbi:MAG: AMP-binding protein [Saprospiraceae bacterium]|nr:AMP-binding protein [Saprospiraceae bacterium]
MSSSTINLNLILSKFAQGGTFTNVIIDEDLEGSCFNILCCLLHNRDLYFYDNDVAEVFSISKVVNKNSLLDDIKKSDSKIYLKTSGTTGISKIIDQNIKKLLTGVILNNDVSNIVWGFCYSARHISGLYMILQAICSDSTLVDLRNLSKKDVEDRIVNSKVTHISAPSTFFRINLPLNNSVDSVITVSNGGEPLDLTIISNVKRSFPNAKIRNIYASTEFGSLLISNGNTFRIPSRLSDKIIIKNDIILVHHSLVSSSAKIVDGWFITNDRVTWEDDLNFRIVGRITEDIKVLGHLVSIRTVEAAINDIVGVKMSKVTSKPHNIFGNLLSAEVELHNGVLLTKIDIKSSLKLKLKDYEIPSKIEIVEQINLTYSGKLSRT